MRDCELLVVIVLVLSRSRRCSCSNQLTRLLPSFFNCEHRFAEHEHEEFRTIPQSHTLIWESLAHKPGEGDGCVINLQIEPWADPSGRIARNERGGAVCCLKQNYTKMEKMTRNTDPRLAYARRSLKKILQ